MDKDEEAEEKRHYWETFYKEHAEIIRKAMEKNAEEAQKAEPAEVVGDAVESPESPFEAVVYFQGISSYTAEIWSTKQVKVNEPLIRFTYWIIITDPGFAGRDIKDSLQSDYSKLDIRFKEGLMRDLKGFQYRHFAGNSFRVRFTLNTESGKVIYQDLTL